MTAPAQTGFGSIVISRMAEMSLEANVELNFASDGLIWRIQCPIEKVLEGNIPAIVKNAKPVESRASGQRPRILVVEDEVVIALEIGEMLAGAGFDIVGPAISVAQALDLLEQCGCDAAVIDVNLGRETSEPVASELKRRGAPFLTLSGYSGEQQPSAFSGVPALTKPVQRSFSLRRSGPV